jgi:hypothetical protein
MRRLAYMVALALVAMFVLAPGAMAQQMKGQHMMPNGQMMDDPQMMGANNMMASPSASASASPSVTASTSATASPTATATASAPRSHHHHGGGGSSASAAVGGLLPRTGGVPLVSLVSAGALALLMGSGLVAARLLRRST